MQRIIKAYDGEGVLEKRTAACFRHLDGMRCASRSAAVSVTRPGAEDSIPKLAEIV